MNVTNLAFYIGKSSNKNVVIYSFNINNTIDKNNPLSSYWIMRENNNTIEDLNFIERSQAYGHTILDNPLDNNDIPFKIAAIDDILLIRKNPNETNKYNVIIILDTGSGPSEYILKKVFLHLSGPLDQTVDKIDYIYEDITTNKLSTFQILNN